jgi:hypothetical protein
MFQWFKPMVSVSQYAPVLRAALDAEQRSSVRPGTDAVRSVMATLGRLDQVEIDKQRILNISKAFEEVNARRLELEAIKPEPRLSAVHTEAVKLCRCRLEVLNKENLDFISRFKGDEQASRKARSDWYSWSETHKAIRAKLAGALLKLETSQPTLYELLGLPGDTVQDLAK